MRSPSGVTGASVAYHLARLGRRDIVLLEQGRLTCGTTWHAAGLVGQLRATESSTRLVQYSTDLYSRLEEETGLSAGFKRCGGLTVARSEDRMTQLRRTAATAEAFDLQRESEKVRARYGVTVVAIKPRDSGFTYATADTVLDEGDVLVVAGPSDSCEAFARLT